MSDEEDAGDSTLKVKSPGWRLAELTALVRKLDSRKDEDRLTSVKSGIRLKRVPSSSPIKRTPSKRIKRFVQPNCDVQPIAEDAEEGPESEDDIAH